MKSHMPPIVLAIALGCLVPSCRADLPDVEISVLVTNEEGKPIPQATVGGFFPGVYAAGESVKGQNVRALTNPDGRAALIGKAAGAIGGGVECPGYYRTQFSAVEVLGPNKANKKLKIERTVVLKPLSKPIPLYARSFAHTKLPNLNKPCGFDLEVGDWVVPFGKGANTDIIFEIKGTFKSYREHDLTLELSFPNRGDGLIEFPGVRAVGSRLRSAHFAPADGYRARLSLHRKALYEQDSSQWTNQSKSGSNYYLRLRTVLDKEGNVVSAHYGKIYGNFEFLDFIKTESYYFNPKANDRNIEFDLKQNLAKPVDSSEKITMP